MNRIFYAMVACSFLYAAWLQITWDPPDAPVVEAVVPVPGQDHADPVVRALADEVAALRPTPETPAAPVSPMRAMQDALLGKAAAAVELVIGLIGGMALFLGLMKVGQDAGLLSGIARLLRPLMVRLFPEVPGDHPAMGAMILNLSANALGLANAATPFGIKAMEELDRLNPHKGTATNAMALFLAINTSAVTLLPTGVIVMREAVGSQAAADVLPTTLFASLLSTTVAIVAAKTYQRFAADPADITPPEDVVELPPAPPSSGGESVPFAVSLLALLALVAAVPTMVVYGRVVAPWIVPTIVFGLLTAGFVRGVPVYASFVEGAREGWEVALKITPFLVGILAAVGMLDASGLLDLIVGVLDPITAPLGMPAAALPMALLRPLSGSGALAVMIGIMQDPATGPDTYVGLLVSTLQGSTETTFYVLAVYFGAVNVRRVRHALAAALTADVAGAIGAVIACTVWFAYNA